jgi:hypothetical protein
MSTDPYVHTDGFWLGRLSACVGESAVRTQDKRVREDLRACLSEFIASPVPSEELRNILRRYLK